MTLLRAARVTRRVQGASAHSKPGRQAGAHMVFSFPAAGLRAHLGCVTCVSTRDATRRA